MENTLPQTNSSHPKMDGWNTSFLLGWPIFRCELLVSGSVYHAASGFMSKISGCNSSFSSNELLQVRFSTQEVVKLPISQCTGEITPNFYPLLLDGCFKFFFEVLTYRYIFDQVSVGR